MEETTLHPTLQDSFAGQSHSDNEIDVSEMFFLFFKAICIIHLKNVTVWMKLSKTRNDVTFTDISTWILGLNMNFW